jgi:hypothetical protein
MIDLILLTMYLASVAGACTVISKKVPAIIAIPEREISRSFAARPPRLTRAVVLLGPFLERAKYETIIVLYLEKILRRARIWILKSDTFISRSLARLQERSRTMAEKDSQYWQGLKGWKKEQKETVIPSVSMPVILAKDRTESVQKLFQPKDKTLVEPEDIGQEDAPR